MLLRFSPIGAIRTPEVVWAGKMPQRGRRGAAMAGENIREVYRALREAQNRYTYFLLAAAAAAISLVLNQTQSAPLRLSQIPLGFAYYRGA